MRVAVWAARGGGLGPADTTRAGKARAASPGTQRGSASRPRAASPRRRCRARTESQSGGSEEAGKHRPSSAATTPCRLASRGAAFPNGPASLCLPRAGSRREGRRPPAARPCRQTRQSRARRRPSRPARTPPPSVRSSACAPHPPAAAPPPATPSTPDRATSDPRRQRPPAARRERGTSPPARTSDRRTARPCAGGGRAARPPPRLAHAASKCAAAGRGRRCVVRWSAARCPRRRTG
mmetsp:Transcript_12787/g.42489  ORF Transcript_12787/g.42489 Transcript_12787/m.42489 type:complete len:237 (-) Transcript_12787:133-843(-)